MKQPEGCGNIEDVRQAIDALGHETVALIERRACYVEAAARFKTGERSVRASERQRTMLAERRRWAEESNLEPDVIEEVYLTLISYFVDREMQNLRET